MILDELATYLDAQGVMEVPPGGDLYKADMPPDPDDVLVLYETGGREGQLVHDIAGIAYERPRGQVVARSRSYATARALIGSAYTTLAAVQNQTLSGTRYVSCLPLQPPFALAQDDNERFLLAFNFEAVKEVS